MPVAMPLSASRNSRMPFARCRRLLGSTGSTSLNQVSVDAGAAQRRVPLKAPVAGIAMGLVSDDIR